MFCNFFNQLVNTCNVFVYLQILISNNFYYYNKQSFHTITLLATLAISYKNSFVFCGMQQAVGNIGVMQQAALVASLIFKYLHATKQYTACCPNGKWAVRRVAYTFMVVCYALNFFNQFLATCVNYTSSIINLCPKGLMKLTTALLILAPWIIPQQIGLFLMIAVMPKEPR